MTVEQSERRPEPSGARTAEALRQRGDRLLERARELSPAETEGAVTGLRTLDGHLAILSGRLRERLAQAQPQDSGALLVRCSRMLSEVHTLRYEIHEFVASERQRRFVRLDDGLLRLRRIHDPDEMLGQVCQVVTDSCGFDRVMLSRVEGSVWRPWRSFGTGRPREDDETFRRWLAGIPEIRLDGATVESEMVRRRGAVLVRSDDPRVSAELAAVSGSSSYVAAPLVPEDRVVGFLHADYVDHDVVGVDRDVLAAFAKAFGTFFERAVLLQRLEDQRHQVRSALQSLDSVLADLASSAIELARDDSVPARTLDPRMRNTGTGGLEKLLTKRELEVLALIATGASNDRIAEELVITSGTVKSHVKQILRKLRATNRAEAIAVYLRLTIGHGSG